MLLSTAALGGRGGAWLVIHNVDVAYTVQLGLQEDWINQKLISPGAPVRNRGWRESEKDREEGQASVQMLHSSIPLLSSTFYLLFVQCLQCIFWAVPKCDHLDGSVSVAGVFAFANWCWRMHACSRINIHVAVVKTGLPGDQTLLTGEGSMRSSAVNKLQPQTMGGWVVNLVVNPMALVFYVHAIDIYVCRSVEVN